MSKIKTLSILILALVLLSGCQTATKSRDSSKKISEIILGDEEITLDGRAVGSGRRSAVYTANDIVYYESGKDFTYGEGSEKDAHDEKEADAHTVLHVNKAGTYRLKGTLSKGQIAVDLGENAKEDPKAVVTLILDGVDITCTVAPAVIFYNVYECGDAEKAAKDVDTSAAGANVILADGSKNTVNGSYVERIYKPDSVVLNDEKTEVKDAKKLHKYDAAFYSKVSINISGEKEGTGELTIQAENEGLGSEFHLTVNGGKINIFSGNDGINTNRDSISVTTINDGKLSIKVTGQTGEGDGIDSNGWLVINGGTIIAQACATSGDAGIDSDMGIHINGGTVVASGNMLDRIENGGQTHAVFNFEQKQKNRVIRLKSQNGNTVLEAKPENDFSILVVSSPEVTPDVYTLWSDNAQLVGQRGNSMGGGMHPGGKPEFGGDPEGKPPFDGENPFFDDKEKPGGNNPRGDAPPQAETPPELPEKTPSQDKIQRGEKPEGSEFDPTSGLLSEEFDIKEGSNIFSGIKPKDDAIVPEMKMILTSCKASRENIEIKAVVSPFSSNYYVIDNEYIEKINQLF